MAELTNNQGTGSKKERKGIRNRPMPKVDLTAMVDLAFLLITFFMLTTSLNTPNKMDIAMPDKGPITEPILLSEDRTLNLLLAADNEIIYYRGTSEAPKTAPQRIPYGKLGLGSLLEKMRENVKQTTQGKDLIVLVKPADASVTKNLVDALDAIQQASISRFMITKINETEKKML